MLGATLCLLQSLNMFLPFDSLLMAQGAEAPLTPMPFLIMGLVIMFHTVLPGIVILEEGVIKGIVLTVVIWFFYGVLIHTYSTGFDYYVPLIAPLLGTVLSIIRVLVWEYSLLMEEKNGLRKTFGSFVEPRVADFVLSNPDLINRDGQRVTVTIMFADLRGFTRLCERLAPEDVIAILRDCFGKLIHIATANGGTVDKLIGDCMMVVWGNPVPMEDHAAKAVETAFEMQAMMVGLKNKWQSRLGVEIRMGIGIATDEVVAGTIGSEEFCDYTVLGNGVNLAAGLEASCPGDRIYVSEKTYALLRETLPFVQSHQVKIKNNGGSVQAYQVQAWTEEELNQPVETRGPRSPVPFPHSP